MDSAELVINIPSPQPDRASSAVASPAAAAPGESDAAFAPPQYIATLAATSPPVPAPASAAPDASVAAAADAPGPSSYAAAALLHNQLMHQFPPLLMHQSVLCI